MVDAFNIVQDRIARSRLAGDPPDAMISPRLHGIGLFDFHRADELIERGEAAANRELEELGRELALRRLSEPSAAQASRYSLIERAVKRRLRASAAPPLARPQPVAR